MLLMSMLRIINLTSIRYDFSDLPISVPYTVGRVAQGLEGSRSPDSLRGRSALPARWRPHSISDHLLCIGELRKTMFGHPRRAGYLPSDQIGFRCQDAIRY